MIQIAYFTDVLCVWAYVHEIRMRTLQQQYAGQISIRNHFLPLFASVHAKIHKGWKDRGSWQGYGEHVNQVAARFEHVSVHPEIWQAVKPQSSAGPHQFIKALQILETQGLIASESQADFQSRTPVEEAIWRLRLAFFRDVQDISQISVQLALAEAMGFPVDAIQALLDSGEALASLFQDFQLQDEYQVRGSPTLVFNEGRQMLYGNVGYRVIEANISELLAFPAEQASWC